MNDIRDEAAFMRGRWKWSSFGYEAGFPRRCAFTDVDAACQIGEYSLVIECKWWDGEGAIPEIPRGQRLLLQDEVKRGKTALVLFGIAEDNDPWAIYDVKRKLYAWQGVDLEGRRERLKHHIDRALGLAVKR